MTVKLNLPMFVAHAISKNTQATQLFMNLGTFNYVVSSRHNYVNNIPANVYRQVMGALQSAEEQSILKIFKKAFTHVYRLAEEKKSFDVNVKNQMPYKLIDEFSIFEATRSILSYNYKYTDIERSIMSVMFSIQKDNPIPIKLDAILKQDIRILRTAIRDIFADNPLMYSYVSSILMGTGLTMDTFEDISLTRKDCESVVSNVFALLRTEKTFTDGKSSSEVGDIIAHAAHNSPAEVEDLEPIGIFLKLFATAYKNKVNRVAELENTVQTLTERVNTKPQDTRVNSLTELCDEKQRKLNEQQKTVDRQRREIDKLTEQLDLYKQYVATMNRGSEYTENMIERKQEPDIPKGNVVLLGGHPQWLRKFTQRYPWVKITPDTNTFSVEPFKNADVILINSSHMSHAQFFRVANIIKQYKKKVQYVW